MAADSKDNVVALPSMPELKPNDASVEFVTNRAQRRRMAKQDKIFKKGREWSKYNQFIKEAK